jgi:hydrogenase nickel incorporation protein HypA/HybF
MHERALAKQVLTAVLEAGDGGRIVRVEGWLAETEALSADSLQLHFDDLATGTHAEGAELALRLSHVQARCNGCGEVYRPDHHVTLCPSCGSLDGTLLSETGLGIERLVLS